MQKILIKKIVLKLTDLVDKLCIGARLLRCDYCDNMHLPGYSANYLELSGRSGLSRRALALIFSAYM